MINRFLIIAISCCCIFSCLSDDETFTLVQPDQLTESTTDFEEMLISNSNTNIVFQRTMDGITLPLGAIVGIAGAPKGNAINYSYEIIEDMTSAVEGEQYTVSSNSSSIPAGEITTELPIIIDLDNAEQGVPYTIGVRLTSSDIPDFKADPVMFTFTVLCPDAILTGEVSFTSTDNFAGRDTSGTIMISLSGDGTTPGSYVIDDFSFGTYKMAYGPTAPTNGWGALTLNYVCNKISYQGDDYYGDNWSVTEIFESDGPSFKYRWENTYGEFGVVTLTRVDGEDWPSITN